MGAGFLIVREGNYRCRTLELILWCWTEVGSISMNSWFSTHINQDKNKCGQYTSAKKKKKGKVRISKNVLLLNNKKMAETVKIKFFRALDIEQSFAAA